MEYQALYRKWRPSTFAEIVGQEHVTATLQNEIKTGKIAQGYLFCGPRGTGKTTTARVLSKAVNCLQPENGNPCNQCKVCRGIADGSLMDVVEIDAASNNSVENIRTINSEVSYLPSGMTYKVYIIDEVHMLSISAFNALLKTLEEPPAHVIFILATTESHKVPATILSRCQRFDFKRVSQNPMLERLQLVARQDGIQITEEALKLIMKSADGSMRDALSLLDQCAGGRTEEIDADWVRTVTGGTEISRLLSLGGAVWNYDTEQALLQVRQAYAKGYEPVRLLESLLEYVKDLIVCKNSGNPAELIDYPASELEVLMAQAEVVSMGRCLGAMEVLSHAYETTRWAKNGSLILEMALIRLTQEQTEDAHLLERIEQLERKLSGAPVMPVKTVPVPNIQEPVKQKAVAAEPPKEMPKEQPPIVEETPSAASPKMDITSCWTDILMEIESSGNALLSGSLRSGEFRLQGDTLYLLDLLPMLDTPENKKAVEGAVKEICGAEVSVVFVPMGQKIPPQPSQNTDPLQDLANRLTDKINIIS